MCRITRGQGPGRNKTLQPSISYLVVSGRVTNIQEDNYREFPVAHQWHSRMKPEQCSVPNHPWPRTEKKQTIAAIDLFPCGLWESQQDPGRQLSRVSCGPSMATPNERSTNETRAMPCAETPVAKDPKLQPSISLLVVSGTPTMGGKDGTHPAKRPQLSGERDHW